jgi:threonine dehydrogenase-like Zn-dependent dehydrogenase
MKLHLHQNPEDTLSGYTNICLGEADSRDEALDDIVDDAEATELVCDNVLEFVPLPDLMGFLQHVIQKLRHGGTLVLTGVDAYSVSKAFVSYNLNIEEFNVLLHGNQRDETNIKVATLTLYGMVVCLRDLGLTITRQHLEEFNYVIEATRP